MTARLYTLKTNTQRQQEAHDYVTAKVRKEEFDPKLWKWSTLIFYIILFGIIMGILVYKEAKACGELGPDTTIEQINERTL